MANWMVDPFRAKVKDGRIYGRGAVGMKSGLAACIAAVHFLRKSGIELEGRWSLHSVVDEEAGGFGAIDAVAPGRLAKSAIVAEPTWGMVQPAEGGLDWVRVTFFGRSGHTGFHGDNEYVDIVSLIRTTKVIATAVIDHCGVRQAQTRRAQRVH